MAKAELPGSYEQRPEVSPQTFLPPVNGTIVSLAFLPALALPDMISSMKDKESSAGIRPEWDITLSGISAMRNRLGWDRPSAHTQFKRGLLPRVTSNRESNCSAQRDPGPGLRHPV